MGFVRFIVAVRGVNKQIEEAEGLVFVKKRGFCTLTGWESRAALSAFRNAGHHRHAMRVAPFIGKVTTTTWESRSEPGWRESIDRLG